MKHFALIALLALGTSAFAERRECRAAEEDLADVSVKIVQAYNQSDLDRAVAIERQAMKQIDKGEATAKQCGCAGVVAGTAATRLALEKITNIGVLSEAQDELARALKTSESARLEAEKCWRGESLVVGTPRKRS